MKNLREGKKAPRHPEILRYAQDDSFKKERDLNRECPRGALAPLPKNSPSPKRERGFILKVLPEGNEGVR